MTNYELQKLARLQSEYLVAAIKEDDELLDLMFPPRRMDIKQASEFTTIPVATLYAKINEIPHSKVGKKLVFTDRGLTRWMDRKSGGKVVKLEKAV